MRLVVRPAGPSGSAGVPGHGAGGDAGRPGGHQDRPEFTVPLDTLDGAMAMLLDALAHRVAPEEEQGKKRRMNEEEEE